MNASPAATTVSVRRAQDVVRDDVTRDLQEVGVPIDGHGVTGPLGGVAVTPASDGSGLVVAWRMPEARLVAPTEFRRRSEALDVLNRALGEVLAVLGWNAHPYEPGLAHLVSGRGPVTARTARTARTTQGTGHG